MRKVGQILLDLEELMEELVYDHELQTGDILNLVYGYLEIHCPDAFEQYEDGGQPVFYYGPEEDFND